MCVQSGAAPVGEVLGKLTVPATGDVDSVEVIRQDPILAQAAVDGCLELEVHALHQERETHGHLRESSFLRRDPRERT